MRAPSQVGTAEESTGADPTAASDPFSIEAGLAALGYGSFDASQGAFTPGSVSQGSGASVPMQKAGAAPRTGAGSPSPTNAAVAVSTASSSKASPASRHCVEQSHYAERPDVDRGGTRRARLRSVGCFARRAIPGRGSAGLAVTRRGRERSDEKRGRSDKSGGPLVAKQPDARRTDDCAREFVRYVGRPKRCDQQSHDGERGSVDRGGALRARLRRCRDLASFWRERADASGRPPPRRVKSPRHGEPTRRSRVRPIRRPAKTLRPAIPRRRASLRRSGRGSPRPATALPRPRKFPARAGRREGRSPPRRVRSPRHGEPTRPLRVRPIRRPAKTPRPAIPRPRASLRRSGRGSPRSATAPPRPRLSPSLAWSRRVLARAGRRRSRSPPRSVKSPRHGEPTRRSPH